MIVSKICSRAPRLILLTPKSKFMSRSNRTVIRKKQNAHEKLQELPNTEHLEKVNYYGHIVVGLTAAGGLTLLCRYSLPQSGSAPSLFDEAAIWPEFVKQRIQKTYMYFVGGAGMAAAAGLQTIRTPRMMNFMMRGGWTPFLLPLGLTIGSWVIMRGLPYTEHLSAKHMAWALHSASLGVLVAPTLMLAGPALAARAALYTLGVVGGLSALACSAPNDKFLFSRGLLAMPLGCVFAASIGSMFLSPLSVLGAGLYGVALYGGVIVCSGLFLFNTQALVHEAKIVPLNAELYGIMPYDPINRSSLLLTDTVNIFIRIAAMLMTGRKK